MKEFNKKLAIAITSGVGTMTCAYCFALIAFISLPAAISTHDPIVIVGWVAQTFLQLVLLSIIMVGQKAHADTTVNHLKKHIDKTHAKHMVHIQRINDRLGIK